MHGARVENGASVGITAASSTGDTHVEGDEGGIRLRQGVIGAYAGYGWAASERSTPGFYLGVVVPVGFPATQIDAYVQAPPAWTGPVQAGLGGTVDFEAATGYMQLGRQNAKGGGWSVHAGYGVRQSSSSFQGTSPALILGGALHFTTGHRRLQVFAQSAQGRDPEPCFTDPPGSGGRVCTAGRSTRAASLGVAIGWHR